MGAGAEKTGAAAAQTGAKAADAVIYSLDDIIRAMEEAGVDAPAVRPLSEAIFRHTGGNLEGHIRDFPHFVKEVAKITARVRAEAICNGVYDFPPEERPPAFRNPPGRP